MHDLARRARTAVSKTDVTDKNPVMGYIDQIGFNVLPHDRAKYVTSDPYALTLDWMYAIYDFNTAWNEVTWPANLPIPKAYSSKKLPTLARLKSRA